MSTYKLYYFNGRGRAEIARLIFAAAGEKFEDIRYGSDQWPAHKSEMPLGQMPVLEFNGVKLPQSMTIARFLAKQFNLAGKDYFEQAKVDVVVDTLLDLTTALAPAHREQDATKKQELFKTLFAEKLPKLLQNLEIVGKMYGNGGSFFVNNNLTWADLAFYFVSDGLLEVDANVLNDYSLLKQIRAEVEKQPRIAEYLANRPKTPF
jgi:glutathione S-transferase